MHSYTYIRCMCVFICCVSLENEVWSCCCCCVSKGLVAGDTQRIYMYTCVYKCMNTCICHIRKDTQQRQQDPTSLSRDTQHASKYKYVYKCMDTCMYYMYRDTQQQQRNTQQRQRNQT